MPGPLDIRESATATTESQTSIIPWDGV